MDGAQAFPATRSRSRRRRTRKKDGSYLALTFLIGAAFILLFVVILVIVSLSS